MGNQQERAVIAEVLDGQVDQFRYLVERYHKGLIQHLFHMVGDGQTAEDIAQEAFIRAFNKLDQYNPNYAFSTWLYKIADNLAYKSLKKSARVVVSDELEVEVIDYNSPSPEESADKNITKEHIKEAVDSLPTNYKRVITMYYWDNFNYEEIADIIDHPVGTVRTWLFRAKEQLRKELYGQI